MNEKPNPVKKFWADNKTAILVTTLAVATAVVAIQRYGLKQHNDFLRENGLYEEFYNTEEE